LCMGGLDHWSLAFLITYIEAFNIRINLNPYTNR
jgi:hypothetical protein